MPTRWTRTRAWPGGGGEAGSSRVVSLRRSGWSRLRACIACSETIRPSRGVAHDIGLLVGRERRDKVADEVRPARVVARDEADGPIGAEHQAMRPERFEDDVDVGLQLLRRP